MQLPSRTGPLSDVRIIEMAGLGALPFGTQKLADMGADVIRINRVSEVPPEPRVFTYSEYNRGRRSIAVDVKSQSGTDVVKRLVESSDGFVESFRPGVCERLGIGPDDLFSCNHQLVYGRLTGWGQDGALSQTAGHSINYESVTGAIGSIGPRHGPPVPLLTVLGDFAGGGMHLAYGVVCAILEARVSGQGQIIDAAMTDGLASLFAPFYSLARSGGHTPNIGTNFFDGGSPVYNVYETADAQYVTIAPIEPQFYNVLLDALGLDAMSLPDREDPAQWPALAEIFADVFKRRTRGEWEALLSDIDACFAPVYRLHEAHHHAANQSRGVFQPTPDGADVEVTPAPRLSRTPGQPQPNYAYPGADTNAILAEIGIDADTLRSSGVVA